jgi:hypothetical protein
MAPNAGLHFQVAFGPKQPVGTPLYIGLVDQSGLDWATLTTSH